MNTFSATTGSPEETHALAARILKEMPGRTVFALYGGLGSGKTCFTQGMALALGIRQPVTSPTFTLIREYREGNRPLYHIDLYRLRGAQDALDIGLEEYMKRGGFVVIEWAERALELLPKDTIHVRFDVGATPDSRRIKIEYDLSEREL